MECPKCAGQMQRVEEGGVEVDRCASCGGLWFDLREQDQLREREVAARVDTGDTAAGKRLDEVRDIVCPRDGSKLVKMNALDQPHIRYELCSVCGGSFFDAGEFRDLGSGTLFEWLRRVAPGLGRR